MISARVESHAQCDVVRRNQAALATQVSMNPYDARRGPGILLALAIANRGIEAARLDSLLGQQIDSLRTTPVADHELQKVKTMFRAGFVRERETTSGRAEALHHYDRFHAALADINTDLDRYLAVTAEDIRRVAGKYLDPANLVGVIVLPGVAAPEGTR